MKKNILFLFTMAVNMCVHAQSDIPSDKKATKETIKLYNNLQRIRKNGFLFGHQDDLAYGVKWKYKAGRSDINEVAGDYPALYGYDLSHLELDERLNIDTVPFKNIKQYILKNYRDGAVITLSWHGTNPLTGKSAWDNTAGTVASILPGGAKHQLYKSQLDKVAGFIAGLKGSKGEAIPVLYRPFHELTGSWFWWGATSCTPDEFKKIFRFTVAYLRDVKHLHNLLYVYNTGSGFNNPQGFLERYPGDDVIDVLSFDNYQSGEPANGPQFVHDIDRDLTILEQVAKEKNKIPALAEVGYNQIPDANWWTNVLARALQGHSPAYVVIWRNAGYKASDKSIEYYGPYTGHPSASNFVQFYQLKQTLFQKDANREKLYR